MVLQYTILNDHAHVFQYIPWIVEFDLHLLSYMGLICV